MSLVARVGRPRSVERPPCPSCASSEGVVAHGFREVDGERRRSFRCTECGPAFTPGAASRGADAAVRAAVRRVRHETEVPYRILAIALSRHLGIAASHTTVRNWCAEAPPNIEPTGAPCEYLSLLWALRQELTREQDEAA